MQIAADVAISPSALSAGAPDSPPSKDEAAEPLQYRIIRRNGAVVGFEPGKISVAVTKAFIAVNGGRGAASARIRKRVTPLTAASRSAWRCSPRERETPSPGRTK